MIIIYLWLNGSVCSMGMFIFFEYRVFPWELPSRCEPLSRLGKQKQTHETTEDIVFIHHKLMKHYGWISLEEFKKLPIKNVLALFEHTQKEEACEFNKFSVMISSVSKFDANNNVKKFVHMNND